MRKTIFAITLPTLLLAACANTREARLYDALGGETGVARLVDAVTEEYRNDPAIGAMFDETEIDYFKERLREQICEISGGGCIYTGLGMEEAHSGQDVSEAQFNDFVEASRRGMTKIGLPVGTQNRLLARLAPMREDVIHQ